MPVAMATSLPVKIAPAARRSADANDEITPATTNVHPATVASTSSFLKRRKTKTVLICGPANGTVVDRALPAYTVAITGKRRTLVAPTLRSRRCICAKLAIDIDSSATASTNQLHLRWPTIRNDEAMRLRSLVRSTRTARAATTFKTTRVRRHLRAGTTFNVETGGLRLPCEAALGPRSSKSWPTGSGASSTAENGEAVIDDTGSPLTVALLSDGRGLLTGHRPATTNR
jgi:hypothetical protein